MRVKNQDPTLPVYLERYNAYGIGGFISGDVIHSGGNTTDDNSADYLDDGGASKTFKVEDGDVLHVGIDSEYVFNEKTQSNTILSYQYCLIHKNYPPLKGVIYPKSSKVKDRWTLQNLISHVIQLAMSEGYIKQWSGFVNVYAHFLRADLSSFSDCFNYKELQGVKGTVAGKVDLYGIDKEAAGAKRFKPKVLNLYDKHRNGKHTVVNFIDTMLLSPNGSGLKSIGDLIQLPKLDIPDGYSIDRMDLLLAGDKGSFEAYALRDAEIAVYYGLFMQVFVRKELGLKALPVTLAGMAISKYKLLMKDSKADLTVLFGKRKVKTVEWNRKKGKPVYKSGTEMIPTKDLYASLATHCYMGGRNECFATGVTPVDSWSDYDLASAYPCAMLNLKPLDFKAAYETKDVTEFTCDVVGMAYVSFTFPDTTRYPSLPVNTPNGLLYPLSGETYATAPEIQVALGMGCKIEMEIGVIVPFIEGSEPLFLSFIEMMRGKRKSFVKGSIMELLCKECINSLYGKTASGLRDTKGFDVSTGLSKGLQGSAISCPYLASYISGFIRALVSEQIASIPEQYSVLSVTTDGFLTNAPITAIDVTLPASKHFLSLLRLIDSTGEMLECKHRVKQLVMIKTRGALTIIPDGTDLITAKCGIKPDCDKPLQNDWMINLYINRHPLLKVLNPQIISLRDQWLKQSDLINLKREVRVSLEPDFKREPVNPVMNVFEFNNELYQHIYLESKPWRDVDTFMAHKAWFNGWRLGNSNKPEAVVEPVDKSLKDSRFVKLAAKSKVEPIKSVEPEKATKVQDEWLGNCLKTVEDWAGWLDFLTASQYVENLKGLNLNSNRTTAEILRRLFVRAYVHGRWGLVKTDTLVDVAQYLTDRGYPTTRYDFKNVDATKYVNPPRLPRTKPVMELLRVLKERFPTLDFECVVLPND